MSTLCQARQSPWSHGVYIQMVEIKDNTLQVSYMSNYKNILLRKKEVTL